MLRSPCLLKKQAVIKMKNFISQTTKFSSDFNKTSYVYSSISCVLLNLERMLT